MVDDDIDGLTSYAAWLDSVRLMATASPPAWSDGRLAIAVDAMLYAGDEPLRLDRDGADWLLPEHVAPGVGRRDRLVTDRDVIDADLDCATIARADSQQWSTTQGLSLTITDDGHVTVSGEVVLDPAHLQGGRPLGAGLWDLRLRVMFGGLTHGCPLRPRSDPAPPGAWLTATADGHRSVQPYWTSPAPALALDIDEWSHPLTDHLMYAGAALTDRDLEIALPTIAGPPASFPAQLLLLASGTSPASELPVTLATTPTGTTINAELPRKLSGTSWQIWARIGAPGGPPPRKLPLLLTKEGRRLFVRRTPSRDAELDTRHLEPRKLTS
jgi:hypothetical protein